MRVKIEGGAAPGRPRIFDGFDAMVATNGELLMLPVENGLATAEALGAEFYEVDEFRKAAATWPGLIAEFVARVAQKEGVSIPAETVGTRKMTPPPPTTTTTS